MVMTYAIQQNILNYKHLLCRLAAFECKDIHVFDIHYNLLPTGATCILGGSIRSTCWRCRTRSASRAWSRRPGTARSSRPDSPALGGPNTWRSSSAPGRQVQQGIPVGPHQGLAFLIHNPHPDRNPHNQGTRQHTKADHQWFGMPRPQQPDSEQHHAQGDPVAVGVVGFGFRLRMDRFRLRRRHHWARCVKKRTLENIGHACQD